MVTITAITRRLLIPLIALCLPVQAFAATLEDVMERGTLRAGVRQDVPGFGFVNEAGETVGFDVDLVREIGERLGVEVELVPVTASTRVPLLQQGRIDLIAATLTHYRERDDVIDFSIGYFSTPQTVMVHEDSGLTSLDEVTDLRLGTTVGAGVVENVQEAKPEVEVQTFQGYPEAFLAMQQGLVDGVVADIIILAGLRANAPEAEGLVMLEGSVGGGDYGIGVREDDSNWRDAINFALQDIWNDGTWSEIFNKWLGPDTGFGLTEEEVDFTMTMWE